LNSPGSAALASQFPPAHSFVDQAECTSTMKQVLDAVPFGDWVAQSKAGKVGFDPAAAGACRSKLETAACGEALQAALLDGSCFGYGPLPSPSASRGMFHRNGVAGDACTAIHDGPGSPFYGTCDPAQAFCCYLDPTKPGACAAPSGTVTSGSCAAAVDMSNPCQFSSPIALCKLGLTCDPIDKVCTHDDLSPLAAGDACVDMSLTLLGFCMDSYCDVLGDWKCHAKKADGAICQGPAQCASSSCLGGVCGASSFCVAP
jgi:hypothetical protein